MMSDKAAPHRIRSARDNLKAARERNPTVLGANADRKNVDGGGSALVLDSQFGLGMSPFGGLVVFARTVTRLKKASNNWLYFPFTAPPETRSLAIQRVLIAPDSRIEWRDRYGRRHNQSSNHRRS
jgi:hypothetical protein